MIGFLALALPKDIMMTSRYPSYRSVGAVCVLLAAAGVSGCQKLEPQGQSSTMTMLRSGSEQVCVARDVKDVLTRLILPDDSDSGVSDIDRVDATADVSIAYNYTTLAGFDQSVSKASCNTTAAIADQSGRSKSFDLDYDISPSADHQDTFVVSLQAPEAKAYAAQLIDLNAEQAANDRQQHEQEQQEQQAHAQLLSVLSRKWMAGTWISASADSANCADQRALTMNADGTFNSQGNNGRWALTGDQLHFIGAGPNGAFDSSPSITQADAVSFTIVENGSETSWRRCSQAEVAPPMAQSAETRADLNQADAQ